MTLHGNPTLTFPTLQQLRAQIVRINLNWNDVAKKRPLHPQDPSDPAYDWTLYDRAIRYTAQYGMQVLLTILFTPSWANGGGARNVPPTNYTDLRNFAYAAATRYSGHYVPPGETAPLPRDPSVRRRGLLPNPQWPTRRADPQPAVHQRLNRDKLTRVASLTRHRGGERSPVSVERN